MFGFFLQPLYDPLMVTENLHYWEKFGFFGDHLFLDFINTVDDLEKTRESEALPDWNSVLKWAEKSKVINRIEKEALESLSTNKKVITELIAIHELRELGWRILTKIASGEKANAADLTTLSKHIITALSISSLQISSNSFHWKTDPQKTNETLIRIRLAMAANDLLTNHDLDKVAVCGGCTGLFLNKGRGVGRKWCRMNTCGNRAKIKKFRTTNK